MRTMIGRTAVAVTLALLAFALPGVANAAPDRPATPPPTDFWQKMGLMNVAHQGGERENPGNTLFAFKKALADGADVIDMDLTLTKDGALIATHDNEPCHTSNGPCTPFRQLNLDQIRQYDFAYWFSPGLATYYPKNQDPAPPVPYRGVATGDKAPPEGYAASDFRIATFSEILDAFPDTPMNVELKPYADTQATAEAAAAALAAHPGREKDVIINAFSQDMIEKFHAAAPDHLALGGSLEKTVNYITGAPIEPTPVAVQPPDQYNLGTNDNPTIVDTLPLLRPHFEYDGFISVVWPSDYDTDPETGQETPTWYQKLIDQGADAINTMFPSRLHEFLCEKGIPAADGGLRCAEQQCPEGFTGFAPNCEEIPKCPEGTTGTPPNCSIVIVDPVRKLTGLKFAPAKGKLKAGQKKVLSLKTTATPFGMTGRAIIRFKSSNPNVKVNAKIRAIVGRPVKVVVRATRKARGKATITATSGKFQAKVKLTVKPLKKKARKAKKKRR